MYIPKNRIITNQYSNNNKLVYKNNKNVYKGFYYKTYDGKYYTGKNPNDLPNDELLFIEDTDSGFTPTLPQSQIAYTDAPTVLEDVNDPMYSEELVIEYSITKNIDLSKTTLKSLPFQSFPQPTDENYKVGSFLRYFCVKHNENVYIELNKDTYDALNKKDKNWVWELYRPFNLIWTLTGDKKEVEMTNYKIVLLQEQRMKRVGLKEFLKGNYTKFYK